jgi:hypothetical protein
MSIRFVFPQWSVEGRNFWILKLTPISLKKIFWEKFILSFSILFIISETLIFISNYMLKVGDIFFNTTLFIVAISSVTVVSLSLGLGAYFANFRQEYYLKAVESFGGFMALVVNFGYTFLTVFLFGTLAYFYSIGKLINFNDMLIVSLVIWSTLSLSVAVLAGCLGLRRLQNKEY